MWKPKSRRPGLPLKSLAEVCALRGLAELDSFEDRELKLIIHLAANKMRKFAWPTFLGVLTAICTVFTTIVVLKVNLEHS